MTVSQDGFSQVFVYNSVSTARHICETDIYVGILYLERWSRTDIFLDQAQTTRNQNILILKLRIFGAFNMIIFPNSTIWSIYKSTLFTFRTDKNSTQTLAMFEGDHGNHSPFPGSRKRGIGSRFSAEPMKVKMSRWWKLIQVANLDLRTMFAFSCMWRI